MTKNEVFFVKLLKVNKELLNKVIVVTKYTKYFKSVINYEISKKPSQGGPGNCISWEWRRP